MIILKKTLLSIQNLFRQKHNFLDFYRQFIAEGDLCFDVGANMGDRTALFLQLGAKVVAIDPQPDCVQQLKDKFGRNPSVTIEGYGLSSQDGSLELMICDDATTISTFSQKWQTARFKEYQWNRKVTVPVTTLDKIIAKHGIPSFCKIDVEGFESEVLHGLTRPIKTISFEFTYEFADDAYENMRYLESLGDVQFNYTVAENANLKLAHYTSKDTILNHIRHGQSDLWGDIYAVFRG
jgi:FkbM family methyltransferase